MELRVPLAVLARWRKRVHSLIQSPSLCRFCPVPGSEEIVETARAQWLPSGASREGAAMLCARVLMVRDNGALP